MKNYLNGELEIKYPEITRRYKENIWRCYAAISYIYTLLPLGVKGVTKAGKYCGSTELHKN